MGLPLFNNRAEYILYTWRFVTYFKGGEEMRIIDFVDYSGSPHNVQIEPSSEEEYRAFGGSEVLLHEDTKENKTMLKINPGIVYNHQWSNWKGN